MTMRLVLTTAFILTIVPVTLHGQLEKINALALETGTRARIVGAEPASKFTLITVASARPDSLLYSLGGSANTRSLGWQQITKMEVSAGRHTDMSDSVLGSDCSVVPLQASRSEQQVSTVKQEL